MSAFLQDAGYHTYMAGKWHLGEEPEHWPAARGFERDLTLIQGAGSHFDDMWGATVGAPALYPEWGEVLRPLPSFHSSEELTATIIKTSRRTAKTTSPSSPISRYKPRMARFVAGRMAG